MARSGSPARTRPRLRDVAASAGVSLSTASLVFSGKGPVRDSTAERVRAAADALGYHGADPVASSLRAGRTGAVGVVVEGRLGHAFRDPFALGVLDGLSAELDAAGLSMLLLAGHSETPARSWPELSRQGVDAVVFPLCARIDGDLLDDLRRRGIPTIATGYPPAAWVSHVVTDDRGATADLVRHLRGQGHRRIAHVTMPLAPRSRVGRITADAVAAGAYPDSVQRALGFLDVAPDGVVMDTTEPDLANGEAAARVLLDAPATTRPTAVVAQSDIMAAGVIRAAEGLGLRVPEDVSVCGFDGVSLPWLDHELTTVVQPAEAKGSLMGTLLREALAGAGARTIDLDVGLRVGTSSGMAPA